MTKIFNDIVDRKNSATKQNDWRKVRTEISHKRRVYKQLCQGAAAP